MTVNVGSMGLFLSFITVDGDGDGIIGSPLLSGLLAGFNPIFNFEAVHVDNFDLPVPASIWLFFQEQWF